MLFQLQRELSHESPGFGGVSSNCPGPVMQFLSSV